MLRRRPLGGQGTMQRRDPVRNGTQVQLSRTFSQGQLVYTAPITIQNQNMHVEVDTGSSDLWVASDRCQSAACQGKQGYEIYLFSDNNGQETGQRFDIDYLVGSASGPIILSNVSLADTTLPGQAFAVVDEVTNQQLGSMQASGVVGLALESNSIIQDVLVGDGGNANNSETNPSRTGSVLAGLWQGVPTSSRFFSLGLQRLPSDGGNGNSTLTFGDYDRNYVPVGRESAIQFSSAVPDDDGIVRKWKMILNDFFVKVNGTQVQIPLDTFGTASAILDTGSPLNLASVDFLNAMYGAVNVGPAADGSGGYYVDCSLPLEFSVSVGGSLVAIHPLDSSLKQDNSGSGSGGSSGCIGSFQALNRGSQSSTLPAQMILGAPFLRSVYSVYSCDANSVNASNQDCSSPRVGIYPLYNDQTSYQTALSDFNKVRVQGLRLGDDSLVDGSATASSSKGGFGSGAKIAVGVAVGLVGIIGIMAVLLFILKRRRDRMVPDGGSDFGGHGASEVDGKDDLAGGVTMAQLSEKERQKARDLALLHGQFVEDTDGRASPSTGAERTIGTVSQSDWDISSKGYWEARAIRNEYQRRARQQDPSSSSQKSGTQHEQPETDGHESHELVESSSFSAR